MRRSDRQIVAEYYGVTEQDLDEMGKYELDQKQQTIWNLRVIPEPIPHELSDQNLPQLKSFIATVLGRIKARKSSFLG